MSRKPPSSRPVPPLKPLFAPPTVDDGSSHLHRMLIGLLGLFLPPLLWVIHGWRFVGDQRWKLLDSISAYYYSGAVAVFAGILFALAVFFFTYQGYDNQDKGKDRVFAFIAGFAAMGVAFFPTAAPAGSQAPSWWTEPMRAIHYGSAVTLFVSFIVFSLFLFRKSNKKARNGVYLFCGLAMVVCVAWAGIAGSAGGPIFWPESLALGFFALSWLVKAEFDWTLVNAARRAPHYWRHPERLAGDAWKAFRG